MFCKGRWWENVCRVTAIKNSCASCGGWMASSRRNWISIWSSIIMALTNMRIRRGTFFSVEELEAAIEEYLEENNKQPKPFVWTATVEQILAKVNRCKAILETVH